MNGCAAHTERKADNLQYLMGIDVGTTNIKVVVWDEEGNTAAQARSPSPLRRASEDSAVYDSEEIREIVFHLMKQAAAQLEAALPGAVSRLCGIAVTGMGEAGVPLDREGQPLFPIIAWFDRRTEQYESWWAERLTDEELFAITHLRRQHIFTANKLLWLRDNRPDVFARMHRWHCVPDYVGFCLTGGSCMDYTLASRTMLMDFSKRCWSDKLLHMIGMDASVLPQLVPSGSPVGRVTAQAASRCGVAPGTPVFTGGHDHICSALATGVVEPGVVLDSSGTCEELLMAKTDAASVETLGRKGFNTGCHVAPERWYASGGIPASGASVDWFQREFAGAQPDIDAAPGAHGLLFLPHLRGSSSPARDLQSRGAFAGVQAQHTRADFMQAVYEGIAYEMKRMIERLSAGQPVRRIVSTGGGTQNAVWLQTKADMLGLPIEVSETAEAAAFGAALLAGIGAGVYAGVDEAIRRAVRIVRTVAPRMDHTAYYRRAYPVFCQLEGALRPIHTAMSELERNEVE